MTKAVIKTVNDPHISSKLHKYLKEMPQTNMSLNDIQKSLSNIGISLSKRVIEERKKDN